MNPMAMIAQLSIDFNQIETLLKLNCNSHTHLTGTPSFAWVHRSCSQTTSVICFSAHKQ